MPPEESRLTFDSHYDVHKNKNVRVAVRVLNAMTATVAVFRNTEQLRYVGPFTDHVTFENLGRGDTWEDQELIVVAWVTDIVPQSNRMVIQVEIQGGAAPSTEELFKIPSKDGETVVFVGKFRLS